jgi:hypothetical protein
VKHQNIGSIGGGIDGIDRFYLVHLEPDEAEGEPPAVEAKLIDKFNEMFAFESRGPGTSFCYVGNVAWFDDDCAVVKVCLRYDV